MKKLVKDLQSGDYITGEGLVTGVLSEEDSGKFLSYKGRLTIRTILQDYPFGSCLSWKDPLGEVELVPESDPKYRLLIDQLIAHNVETQSSLRDSLDFLHLARRRYIERCTSP